MEFAGTSLVTQLPAAMDNIIANSDIVHDHAVTANQDIVADSYFTYSPDMLIHVIFVQDNIAKNIVGNKSYAGSYFTLLPKESKCGSTPKL